MTTELAIDYVYFMQAGQGGPIKIGRAADPEARTRGVQTSNANTLKVLLLIPDASLERKFHRWFRHHHIKGEWFKAHPEILRFVNTLARQTRQTVRIGRTNYLVGDLGPDWTFPEPAPKPKQEYRGCWAKGLGHLRDPGSRRDE